MSDEVFTKPDETGEKWVDVRMTDPAEGEWDVDAVVVNGQVEYVDLRVKPHLLAEFVDCLVDDVADERARDVLAEVAERHGIDVDTDRERD